LGWHEFSVASWPETLTWAQYKFAVYLPELAALGSYLDMVNKSFEIEKGANVLNRTVSPKSPRMTIFSQQQPTMEKAQS
jgi:hypothetical protein